MIGYHGPVSSSLPSDGGEASELSADGKAYPAIFHNGQPSGKAPPYYQTSASWISGNAHPTRFGQKGGSSVLLSYQTSASISYSLAALGLDRANQGRRRLSEIRMFRRAERPKHFRGKVTLRSTASSGEGKLHVMVQYVEPLGGITTYKS